MKPLSIEDLQNDMSLCKYCPCTEYGLTEINTGPWNLCEGCSCKKPIKII